MARAAVIAVIAILLAGCDSLPDKPVRASLYDFGPGAVVAEAQSAPTQPPIVLPDVETPSSFDGAPIMYRLGYSDPHQLRPYAFARWGAPPPQLVRQKLREQLGRDRLILDSEEASGVARTGGARPRVLRVQLEEFTHYFESQGQSHGLVRLRCTLLESTPAGERPVGQRNFTLRSPASTADASGGVKALAAATEAAAQEVARWLQQLR